MGRLLHRITRPGAVLALLLAVFAGPVSAQDRAPGIPATDPAFMPLLRLADELESKAQNCAAGDCPNVDCAKFADLRTSLAAIKALLGPTEWLSLYGETADKPDGSPRRLEGDVRTLGYWMALLREDTMRHVADVNAGLNRNARRRDNLDRLRMVATFFTDMSKLAQDAIDIASLGKLLVERAPQLMFRFDEPASALKDIADMLGVLDGAIAMVDGVDVFKRQQQVVEGEAAAAGLDLPGSVGTLTNAMGMISDGVGSAVSVRELRKARALAAEALDEARAAANFLHKPIEGASAEAIEVAMRGRAALAAEAQKRAAELAGKAAEATTSLKFSLAQALLTPLTMISDYQIGKLQEELDEITAVMEAEEKAYMNANFEHIKAADRNEALLQAMERFDAALAALESCAASCPDVGMRAPPLDIPVASFRAGPDGRPSEGTAIPWFEKAIGAYVAEASAALDDFVEASAFDRPSVELKPAKTAFGVNERIEIAYSGPACLLRGGFVVFDAGRSQSTRPEGGVASFAGHDKPGRYAYRFVSKRLGVPLTADVLVGEPPGAKAPTRDGGKGQLDWRTVGPFTATCGGGAEGSYTFDIAPRWKAEGGEFAIFWFSGAGNEDDFFRMPGCRWKYLDQTVKSVRITFDDGSVSTSMDGASSHQAFPAGATRVTRIELAVTPAYKQSFQVVWDF